MAVIQIIEYLLVIFGIIACVAILIVGGILIAALSAVWGTTVVTMEDPLKIANFMSSHAVLFLALIVVILILGFFSWDYVSCVAGNVFLALVSSIFFPNKLVTLLLIGSAVLYGFIDKDLFTYKAAFEYKNYKGMALHVLRSALYAELLTLIFSTSTNYVERFLVPHEDKLNGSPALAITFVCLPTIVFLIISRFQKTFSRIDPIALVDKNQSMGFRALYYLFSLIRIAALVLVFVLLFKGTNVITNEKYFFGAIITLVVLLVSSVNTFKNVVTSRVYENSWDQQV